MDLPKRFSNTRPELKSLISRVLRGSERRGPRGRATERHDTRGAVAKNPAKSQTRLTPERRAELVADYVAGTPVRAIATKYGVHRGTIPTLIRRAGAEVRVAGLDAEERKLASSLYENGMTLAQVAGQMGVSDEAVRQAVLDQGGQIRPKGRRPRR
ncbi:sigma-70-like protein [Leucobacter luti]|uniref:Sigma-70-like protein n=1 Tax=Leucobacter luti TaxID=340320 RepID=A0A4R6RU42_9MICO|nr:sigma-70-like protein [Leucobacter luti]